MTLTDYRPTAVEQIVSELTHRGHSDYVGAAKLTTVRLHLHNFTMLQAMTEEASINRSHMHNHLISAGIEAVLADLPDDARQRVEKRRDECLSGLMQARSVHDEGEES